MSEHNEQVALMNWWAGRYPKYYECLFAIPNGAILAGNATSRARQMNYLKAEGFKPGVSDLFLMVAREDYNGLFIEMKDKGKTKCSVNTNQLEHMNCAIEQGYMAEWCAGFEEARELIDSYMKGDL